MSGSKRVDRPRHHADATSPRYWLISTASLRLPFPIPTKSFLYLISQFHTVRRFVFHPLRSTPMAEEKHHHHGLFHHKDENRPASEEAVVYSETAYGSGDGAGGYSVEETEVYGEAKHDYKKEEKHHKHLEHVGELGAVAAGAYALHEKHKAEKDPEHAHKHKIEEEVAAAAAVGAGGFAFHEHHEKKEAKKEDEEAHGKKHHHLF